MLEEGPHSAWPCWRESARVAWTSVEEACRATLHTVLRDEADPGRTRQYARLHGFYSSPMPH